MKVLFVGEGAHDVGTDTTEPKYPQPKPSGVVPALTARVIDVDEDSVAITWRAVARLLPNPRVNQGTGGHANKVKLAMTIGARRYGCEALVCVTDRDVSERTDDPEERIRAMRKGRDSVADPLPCALGEAVRTIEAWTLGAPVAIAETISVEESAIVALMPKEHVETLSEWSGKPERRPKALLARIFASAKAQDSRELRARIAACTDVDALARACPEGFAPFLAELRGLTTPP